jgi:hypothetical protein
VFHDFMRRAVFGDDVAPGTPFRDGAGGSSGIDQGTSTLVRREVTATGFSFQWRATGDLGTDYVEWLEGKLTDVGLVVKYGMDGKASSADVHARAEGTLAPQPDVLKLLQ